MYEALRHPLYSCKVVVSYTEHGEERTPRKRLVLPLHVLSAYITLLNSVSLCLNGLWHTLWLCLYYLVYSLHNNWFSIKVWIIFSPQHHGSEENIVNLQVIDLPNRGCSLEWYKCLNKLQMHIDKLNKIFPVCSNLAANSILFL